MRAAILIGALSLGAGAGAADAAPSLEIRAAAVRVTIVPESRADISVEALASHPGLPLEIRPGERTIVDGGLDRRLRGCRTIDGRTFVEIAGVGDVPYDQLPRIVVRTPRDVRVMVRGAVYGEVGRSASLELANAGCGDWTVANVAERLRLSLAGSGDTHAGTAGEAVIRVAGSGDVSTQGIAGPLSVDVAGSGDVAAASVSGPLDVKVAGSGDVKVGQGRAGAMTVAVGGSGDVTFGGVAGRLDARIAGSGDVKVHRVTGPVSRRVIGSGRVSVGP